MKAKFFIGGFLLLLLLGLDFFLGSEDISLLDALAGEKISMEILTVFRLPKLIAAVLSGIALSCSGIVMQTIFRNPLAGPYMLGVSSGASLGVALFLMATPIIGMSFLNVFGVAASAWLGAILVLILVLYISSRLKDIMAILILGMMIGSATSAFVDLLQFFSSESALKGYVLWSMGHLGGLSWIQLLLFSICVLVGLFIAVLRLKTLDVLLLGENYASTMGVNVRGTRTIMFVSTALLAGSVTAFCGPISFVGIAAPHIARMIWKRAAHRVLVPASVVVGVVMMLLCDIISSTTLGGYPLPLNTVTAFFGIPVVFLIVLKGNRGKIM